MIVCAGEHEMDERDTMGGTGQMKRIRIERNASMTRGEYYLSF